MFLTNQQKKVIGLTSLGGALEFYDFTIFVFFAKILGDLFFPSNNPVVSLIASWSLYAAGYLVRPLGGVILGHIGDRTGRKNTFLITLIGMAIPSLLIGLLPSYQTIGIIAPILLIVFRLVQGFCMGGEVPGALVFITEVTPTRNRALICSILFAGYNLGLLFGSLISNVLSHVMSTKSLVAWGWRLPFCLGGVLCILGFYLRRKLHETPLFLELQKNKKNAVFPLKKVLSENFAQIFQGSLLISFTAIFSCLLFLFMPTYLSTYFNYPVDKLLILNTLSIVIYSFFPILIGYYADQWGYLKILRIGSLGLLLFTYPMYHLFQVKVFFWVIFATLVLVNIGNLVVSVFIGMLVAMFPTKVRYTGVALTYNLGFAIAGGLTPLLMTYLIHISGNRLIPGIYLTLFAGSVFLLSFFMRETRGVALQDI